MAFTDTTFWVYSWDITDTDVQDRLRTIHGLGANAISIPFAYHSVRALAPHREGRKVFSSAAALGFRPHPSEFPAPGIQPFCAEWATEEGPVGNLVPVAETIGLRVTAWTVVFHSTPLASANPGSAITNCFGDIFQHALCPSAPRAREYALRLVRAIAGRSVHAIELESLGFQGYHHLSHHDKCGVTFDLFHHFLFSCCFCLHCRKFFEAVAIDADEVAAAFRERLGTFLERGAPILNDATLAREELGRLLGNEVAVALLRARSQCVLSLLQEIREAVPRSIGLTVSSGLSAFEFGALLGAEPQETLHAADRLLLVVFEPNETAFRDRFEAALDCVSDRSRWIAGIRIFPPDVTSEAAITSRLDFLEANGFGAVQLYHYGLAPAHLLTATANALARLQGAPRD
jgi:hypothetical protein